MSDMTNHSCHDHSMFDDDDLVAHHNPATTTTGAVFAEPHTDVAPTAPLVYWRCLACLEAFCVPEGQKVAHPCHDFNDVNKDVEHMGRASTDRKRYATLESACDARCTNAVGPLCVCRCKCANHGSGRTIERWHALPEATKSKHRDLAAIYHGKMADAILEGIATVNSLRSANGPWRLRYDLSDAVNAARKARTLKKRTETTDRLLALIAQAKPAAVEAVDEAADAVSAFDAAIAAARNAD